MSYIRQLPEDEVSKLENTQSVCMYHYRIRSCSCILCGCFTSSNFTDEISAARAELGRLEKRENELLKQLADTRAAAQAQRRRLEDLVRSGKPPINRLPVESLLQIIGLAIRASPSDDLSCNRINQIRRKGELAGVSRHWRNLIFGCPNLWTEITLAQRLSPSVVHMHAIRSRTCLIDVYIDAWYRDSNKLYLGEMLDAVVACVSRWRTFTVLTSSCQEVFSLIFRSIDGLCFSCLSSVDIPAELFPDGGPQAGYQRCFQPQNIPRLKHAVLHTQYDDIDVPLGLETLSLTLHRYCNEPRSSRSAIPIFLSLQTLKVLSLSGNISHWRLQPNSINLPLLEKITLQLVSGPGEFLEALVAPQLRHCDYQRYVSQLRQTPPSNPGCVLSSVQSLSFWLCSEPDYQYDEAKAISLAFPGVRHVELLSEDIPNIFDMCKGPCIADNWENLQHITFIGLADEVLRMPNVFILWLQHRRNMGLPVLHVVFSKIQYDEAWGYNSTWLLALYQSLHEYCTLEFENVPLSPPLTFSGNVAEPSSTKVVCDLF